MSTLTLKFNLENNIDIENTISNYISALNFVSEEAFKIDTKFKNPIKLQKLYYYDVREKFNLPSQMACSIFREVAGQYKKENKKNKNKPICFCNKHMKIVFNRDFSFKDSILSLSTINGRKKFNINICEYYKELLSKSIKFCDSSININKHKIYFNLTIEVPDKELKTFGNTMGIDLGLSKLATAYINNGKTLVINGGKIKDKKNKYLKLRKQLQHKGTRSAKRKLKSISGRENRFMRDVNFCAVKKLLEFAEQNNVSHIGLEDLSGIRNTKLRKEQRRELNSWSFYQFRTILEYKAKLKGINTIIVNPAYTSQTCNKCGYTDKSNRKTQKQFLCKSCGHIHNADINASQNIEFLTRYLRSNLNIKADINQSNVSNVEVKGLNIKQLRQSLETSQMF